MLFKCYYAVLYLVWAILPWPVLTTCTVISVMRQFHEFFWIEFWRFFDIRSYCALDRSVVEPVDNTVLTTLHTTALQLLSPTLTHWPQIVSFGPGSFDRFFNKWLVLKSKELKSVLNLKRQLFKLVILQPFLVILLPIIFIFFTKVRFRQSFWGA